MRKFIAIIITAMILVMTNGTTVNESEWACYTAYTPNLSFIGTTATCKRKVIASNVLHPIEATVVLKHAIPLLNNGIT